MEEVFLEALRAERRKGWGAALRFWLREAGDLAVTGHRMRAESRRYGADFVARGVRRRWTRGRGGRTMGVMDDLRYAVRSLVRRPSLTLFAVLTVGLGVGATTAMFSTVESVVLNPLPYETGDRLAGIFRKLGDAAYVTPRQEDLAAWAQQTDLFEAIEPWSGRAMTLTGAGEPREIQAALIRGSYHDLLGWGPLVGRSFDESETAGEGVRVLMLSEGFAMRMFGTPEAALGETLSLDGEPWSVVGVMPRGSLVPGWGLHAVDVWRPMSDDIAAGANPALALLREGVDVSVVNERLRSLGTTPDGMRSVGFAQLVAEQVGAGMREHLGLLMGAVVLLLLIACVNVSNLLLFRANARKRETAVRSALGGGRGRLTRQMLIESVVLALLGGTLGIAVSYVGQAAILELRPEQLEILDHVSINARVLLFALAITVGAGLLFGLLPALQASRPDAMAPLRSGVRTEGDIVGRRLRWVLVAGEVALSFALLIGSLAVLTTMVERQRTDPGFRAEEVAVMTVAAPDWRYETSEQLGHLYDAVLDRLRELPGVEHAARATGAPPRAGVTFGTVEIEGEPPTGDTKVIHGPFIREGYFEALGQAVLRGRTFTAEDLTADEITVMLSESTARALFGDQDPVGLRFRIGGDAGWRTVIGIVADVPMTGLSTTRQILQAYHPLRDHWDSQVFLVRAGSGEDLPALMGLMKEAAGAVDADLRVDRVALAADRLRDTLDRERFATTVMSVFAGFALLLAAVGLYGVVSQVVGQRTREIGIRIALGARKASIASLVLKRAGGATAFGIAGGVPLALAAKRVLDSQVVGAEASSWSTYVLAALALGLTSLLASYVPARRASSVDPVEAMRVE